MAHEAYPPKPSQDTATLVKRLAGPSTGKAGLSKDQTEINRIIAEASKGSKFYDNEKKKDKDLTERIARILKQRDDEVKGADIRKIEISADNLLAELESQRDSSQTIVHVDMDAFFANVELLNNPELEGKPFGVGRGVLTTASYEARKYGVRSGMPGFIAKKLCPDLIFVGNNFLRYKEMSENIMSVFKRYDPNMCVAGCDEGYLNITAYCEEHSIGADECVQEIRDTVHEETKLTVSAGIAPNKMLAKICSDKNKPNGQFHLPFDRKSIITFMHDLSIRKVPGIGRVNERLLESIGIKTCGDIYTYRATLSLMDKQFGLKFLLRTHLGIASNTVQPHQRQERKSIGAERTFNPLGEKEKILQKLDEVAAELENDMEENGWTGRTVTLKFKLDTYQVFTRAKSFDRWITKKEDLYATGKELLLPEFPLKIRLIGLRLTKLKDLRSSSLSTRGIQQFFEPIKSGSPNKKRKLEQEEVDHSHTIDDTSDICRDHDQDHDEYEEAMPGFHEHDDNDVEISLGDIDEDGEDVAQSLDKMLSRPRPPASAPARANPQQPFQQAGATASTSATSVSRIISKPRSTSHAAQSSELPSGLSIAATKQISGKDLENTHPTKRTRAAESHECPVCGKALQTDNHGLNTHIDFCLSRGAIREAQSEASSPAGTKKDKVGMKQPIKWKGKR